MSFSLPSPMAPLLLSPPALVLMIGIILSSLLSSKKIAAYAVTIISAMTDTNGVQTLPPSPPKLPIIGNLHQLSSLPHRSLRSLSDRYGPLMLLRLGSLPVLVISSASIVREVIQKHDHIFASRPSLKAPYELLYHGRDIAFAPYGEYWRKMKKVSILHLLSNKKVASYKQVREEEVVFMMKEIEGTMVVDMTERFNAISRDVISRAVIGKATRNRWWEDEVESLVKESTKLAGEFYVGDYIPWLGKIDRVVNGFEGRVRKTFQRSDKLLEEIIKEHRRGAEKRKEEGGDSNTADECFLDVLLTLEEELKWEGIVFDSKSIKAIIMVIRIC